MDSATIAPDASVTAQPLLSVMVGGEPYNFEIPADFVPPQMKGALAEQALQDFQDRTAPWMNEALPLEARFELLRSYTALLRKQGNEAQRDLERAQALLREHAAFDQKAYLVKSPNMEVMVFKISDTFRIKTALQALYKDDSEDYSCVEVAGKFIFLKEPILTGDDAHRALEEHAKRLHESSSNKFTAWADLTPMERQKWRDKAMESKKYMLLYFTTRNKSELVRASELTGMQLRAFFAMEHDHRLLLINDAGGPDNILEDDAVVCAQAGVITLTAMPPTNQG